MLTLPRLLVNLAFLLYVEQSDPKAWVLHFAFNTQVTLDAEQTEACKKAFVIEPQHVLPAKSFQRH